MRVLFAINSNGLGHTTRCIPLISALLKRGHDVYLMSSKRPLEFLRREFGDKVQEYFHVKDYSFEYKIFKKDKVSTSQLLVLLPYFFNEGNKEYRATLRLHKKYKFECVISDSRLGVHIDGIPNYLISNHVRMIIPNLPFAELFSELVYYYFMSKFKKLLIPDNKKNSIAGAYTHGFKILRKKHVEYLGILSMLKKTDVRQDIDYFFSVSGPEPQRTVFEKKVLKIISRLQGKKVVVTLGNTEDNRVVKKGSVEIYGCLDREKQTDIMNRAKMVITRSGLSTTGELATLRKKGILIPTKGQFEQEYIAGFHHRRKNFMRVNLDDFGIDDLAKAEKYLGFRGEADTSKSVKRFLEITKL